MSSAGDFFEKAKNGFVKKANEISDKAKYSIEIESSKSRLSEVYKRIGEIVVADSTSEKKTDEELLFKYIDEARLEKEKLKELMKKRNEISQKAECPSCGKQGKNGTYCDSCGEFIR